MSVCIQVINPNTSLAMTETIGAAARAVAAPGTEILAVCPSAGVPSIEGHFDEAIAAVGVLEQVRLGREQGVDGHVIACFGDPGLLAARELYGHDQAAAAPLTLAGERVAFNVCYEDSFGEELIGPAREATLLANVSNMAWFDGSWAAQQHLQMARARSLETGRWMIRATNTGATAIVNHHGRITAQLQPLRAGILEDFVENRTGLTPYLRWGDTPTLGLLGALVVFLLLRARRRYA